MGDGSVGPLSVFKDRDSGSDSNGRGRTSFVPGRRSIVVTHGVLDHLVHDGSGLNFFDFTVFVPLDGVRAASEFDNDTFVPFAFFEKGNRCSGRIGTGLSRGATSGIILGVVLCVGHHFVDLVAVVVIIGGSVLPGHRVHSRGFAVGGNATRPPPLIGKVVVDLCTYVPRTIVVEFANGLTLTRGCLEGNRIGHGLGSKITDTGSRSYRKECTDSDKDLGKGLHFIAV
mmetsp:Transcript_7539/g.16262  ORF Transcript_7539/g.16262 Transcript_7539/m.16262 type:complete len:228 (+) Transcript_7539:1011-1694(+)